MKEGFKIEDNQLVKTDEIRYDIDGLINQKNTLLNTINSLNIEIDRLDVLINKAIELGYNSK